jgi:DNA end-binding protein Ku
MARAVWNGSLSFGLVVVPVALYPAVRERTVRFNQFQRGTSDRVRMRRVNERTGDDVPFDEIDKGYDLGGGRYVLITPEELAAVAPGKSRTIDVTAFVDLAEIDPMYFDRSYWMAPPEKNAPKGTERAYALLAEAMRQSGRAAIATFVMRERQHVAAVRAAGDALVLETMAFADEIVASTQAAPTLPVEATYGEAELKMAEQLISSMVVPWDPSAFRDEYRERVESLIAQKEAGAVVAASAPEPEAAPVIDLLAALEASVQARRAEAKPTTVESRRAGTKRKAAGSTRAKPRSVDDEFTTMTRVELQQRAAQLGVAGRSRMDRQELEAAVRQAQRRAAS